MFSSENFVITGNNVTGCERDKRELRLRLFHLLFESTAIARGRSSLLLNISRLFEPLVVISAMIPSSKSV